MIRLVEVIKQRECTIEDVCLHEAGHAAMAFEFGVPVNCTQIEWDPANGNTGGITNIEVDFLGLLTTKAMREILKKDHVAFFKSGADAIYDLHISRIFVLMGGIAVEQRIRGITNPGCIPGYNPAEGTSITNDTVDDSDLIEDMIPALRDVEHRYHHARAISAFRGAVSDVHHIMDNPGVTRGMQALADALLVEKNLSGEQARKIYFDARGPIQPVSGTSLKKMRRRLRKALPQIDLSGLIEEVKARDEDEPERVEA